MRPAAATPVGGPQAAGRRWGISRVLFVGIAAVAAGLILSQAALVRDMLREPYHLEFLYSSDLVISDQEMVPFRPVDTESPQPFQWVTKIEDSSLLPNSDRNWDRSWMASAHDEIARRAKACAAAAAKTPFAGASAAAPCFVRLTVQGGPSSPTPWAASSHTVRARFIRWPVAAVLQLLGLPIALGLLLLALAVLAFLREPDTYRAWLAFGSLLVVALYEALRFDAVSFHRFSLLYAFTFALLPACTLIAALCAHHRRPPPSPIMAATLAALTMMTFGYLLWREADRGLWLMVVQANLLVTLTVCAFLMILNFDIVIQSVNGTDDNAFSLMPVGVCIVMILFTITLWRGTAPPGEIMFLPPLILIWLVGRSVLGPARPEWDWRSVPLYLALIAVTLALIKPSWLDLIAWIAGAVFVFALQQGIAQQNLRLQEQLQEAEILNSDLRHAVHTPLAVIRNTAQDIAETVDDPAERAHLLERAAIICRRVEEVKSVIDGASQVLRSGEVRRDEWREVELKSLLQQVVDGVVAGQAERVAAGLRIEFDGESSGGSVVVSAHPEHLRQVFVNLITNAVEAISGPGTVTVRVRFENMWPEIDVIDTGHGIPPDIAPRIFEMGVGSKPFGGNGLYVVRKRIAQLSGKIGHQPRPGGGTVFTVRLPAVRL